MAMRGGDVATRPRVSLGVPVYNGLPFLEEALDSLLSQTFDNLEVVFCDNASTDGSPDFVEQRAAKDDRIRVFRHENNLGASRNYNRVFEEARGDYFKWAAADDVLLPTYLEKCVEIGPRPRAPRDMVRDGWIKACEGDEEAMRAVRRQIWDEARYD